MNNLLMKLVLKINNLEIAKLCFKKKKCDYVAIFERLLGFRLFLTEFEDPYRLIAFIVLAFISNFLVLNCDSEKQEDYLRENDKSE